MYDYPLVFEINTDGLCAGMQVRGAGKQVVMHGSKMPDAVAKGKQPYQVVNTPEQRLPVCQIQLQEVDDESHYVVSAPDGARLGTVVDKGWGRWILMDANGAAVGHIRQKNRWRHAFLFELLSSSTLEAVAALVFRIRYEVVLNELRAMQLREMDSEFRKYQGYRLKKFADLGDRDDLLLLAGLWAALWSLC